MLPGDAAEDADQLEAGLFVEADRGGVGRFADHRDHLPETARRALVDQPSEQGRADDNDESIAKRLSIYESETAPILDVYRERGVVDEIDGVGSLDEVFERIIVALAARGIVA